MVAVDAGHVAAGQENHQKDHYDEQQNEGAGAEGAVVQVVAGQRAGY